MSDSPAPLNQFPV
ncbi:hypothetical protein AYI70_g4649, partial [Smittium culicis]